ncbi:MAG TPA: GNAT family N-acetyltransferase [Geminicoccaceae bacterium]|nr:GNAT family N-acetyltransferase [Geminicoccaceae bacterium]
MARDKLASAAQQLPDNVLRKLVSAEDAVADIRPGEQVFIGTACATPRSLVAALENRRPPPPDVTFWHFLTNGAIPVENGKVSTSYQHRSFFVGTDNRLAVAQGKADYIPISIAQVTALLENRRIALDAALIQVSRPDRYGYVSLGVSVDIVPAAVGNARTVLAEINPNMPRTMGETFLHVDDIDRFVWADVPVIEYIHEPADEVGHQIARYIAGIIGDGATLQVGPGRIPNEAMRQLENRRDLGIHSDVIGDSIVPLVEQGVITGRRKSIHQGQIVASFCIGSERLYRLIDGNPLFSFHPIEYVCDPAIMAKNRHLVSITQAFAVDLTGQVCADQFEGEFYSGVAAQPDFLRAAALSEGGKPIICLPSTTPDDGQSRIRPLLHEGEGVTIARQDVHYVVTEYGIAYLFGRSIRERALALIEIAHPNFRPWLLDEAKRLGYVRAEQSLQSSVPYPIEEERHVVLKNGRSVLLRPARASDAGSLQALFYDLPPDDVYTRFFQRLKSMTLQEAERYCNVNYDTAVAFLAVVGDREREEVVGSACYFVNPSTNMAEVAYMILPQWQGTGLGSALQQRLIEYARQRGLLGFTAEILASNARMLRLAKRACDHVSVERDGDTVEVTMRF